MRVYCNIVTFSIFPIKIFFLFFNEKIYWNQNVNMWPVASLLLLTYILFWWKSWCFAFCFVFFLRTKLVFIKNPNQVHGIYNVYFLPYFYSNKIYFTTKLDKVTSVIFKQIKHFIIIESSLNHLEKALSIPCPNNLIN